MVVVEPSLLIVHLHPIDKDGVGVLQDINFFKTIELDTNCFDLQTICINLEVRILKVCSPGFVTGIRLMEMDLSFIHQII